MLEALFSVDPLRGYITRLTESSSVSAVALVSRVEWSRVELRVRQLEAS
jgi:hypothetical protein